MEENLHWWKIFNDGWFEFYSCKQCGINFKLALNTDDKNMPLECPYCGFRGDFIKEKEQMKKDYKYYVELCNKQDYERIFPNKEEMDKSKNFYKENGFHYEDIWNLDRTIIKFILPRLAYFRDNHDSVPQPIFEMMKMALSDEQINSGKYDKEAEDCWCEKITEILNGFEAYLVRDEFEWTQEDKVAIEKAWNNFRKYFKYFWN